MSASFLVASEYNVVLRPAKRLWFPIDGQGLRIGRIQRDRSMDVAIDRDRCPGIDCLERLSAIEISDQHFASRKERGRSTGVRFARLASCRSQRILQRGRFSPFRLLCWC